MGKLLKSLENRLGNGSGNGKVKALKSLHFSGNVPMGTLGKLILGKLLGKLKCLGTNLGKVNIILGKLLKLVYFSGKARWESSFSIIYHLSGRFPVKTSVSSCVNGPPGTSKYVLLRLPFGATETTFFRSFNSCFHSGNL